MTLQLTTNNLRPKLKSKQKYLLLFVVGCLLLVVSLNTALAASPTTPTSGSACKEVPLPNLPGIADPCTSPAAYIQYWYYLGLYLGGIAALMAIVIAGAYRVFFAWSPGQVSKADHYITNAVLGLILLFGSWLLLRTLGGAAYTLIKNPTLPPLPSVGYSSPIPANGKAGDACTVAAVGPSAQGTCSNGLVCDKSICKLAACISLPAGCSGLGPAGCTSGPFAACCAWVNSTCVYKNP